MRVIILLKPTNKRGTKTAYTKFRNRLAENGFIMVAPELYMRVVASRKAAGRARNHVKEWLPETGTVVFMTMTERQWNKIEYLVGERSLQERVIGSSCHIIIG